MASIAVRTLNGWPLFLTIAAMTFIAISTAALLIGISTPESTVNLIRLSVQLASLWIFLVFAASAMAQLFPGNISSWLLRNRRYLGLSFAAGFSWQAVFIAVLFTLYSPHYRAAIWASYAELAFSSSATVISFVFVNLGLLTLSLRVAENLKRRTNELEMSS
ncbi:MAG: hypothetical protein ACPHAN_04195 [Pseudomonadales bacterium]